MKPQTLIAGASVLALAAAGCGTATTASTTQNQQQQIRTMQTQTIEKLISDHPEDACQDYQDPSQCLQGVIMTKGMSLHIRALLPTNWRYRVAHDPVTISGNTATMPAFETGQPIHKYVKVNGRWLIQ